MGISYPQGSMYLRSNRKEVKDLLVPGMKFLLYVESFRKNWDHGEPGPRLAD
jgi:hypothetical protein